jgi:hypothetical protein
MEDAIKNGVPTTQPSYPKTAREGQYPV